MFLDGGGSALSSRPFAEQTQAVIDSEVSRLLREAEQRAVDVLRAHLDVLDKLVELLLAKETIDGSEVYALTGRPEPRSGTRMTLAPDHGASAQGPPDSMGNTKAQEEPAG